MSVFIVLYGLVALFYTYFEFKTFDVLELEGETTLLKVLHSLHLAMHLFRAALVWPLYVLDDFLVYVLNRLEFDDDIPEP